MPSHSFPYNYCISLNVEHISQAQILQSNTGAMRHLSHDMNEVLELSWSVLHFVDNTPSVIHQHRSIVKPPTLVLTPMVSQETGITAPLLEEEGIDLKEAINLLDSFVKDTIGSESFCFLTYGRWDLAVFLRQAVERDTDITLPSYFYNFYDVRDLFLWGHNLLHPFVKPKSSSLQSICDSFHVEMPSQARRLTGFQYASLLSQILTKVVHTLSSLQLSFTGDNDHFVYPSAINWYTMQEDFKANKGTLLRILDLPFTTTAIEVKEWMVEMGVTARPSLCQRELHLERLRPSGTAFVRFDNHEDALTLLMHKGVKINTRMPYVEATTEEVMAQSTTMAFPPSLEEFAASRSTVIRLGSLFWNTSLTDIIMWCYQITNSGPTGAWMASLADGRSTGVGWVRFSDPYAAVRLLETAVNNELPLMYDRAIIVDPADDKEIEFAQTISILSPFPDWIYVPVPLPCVGIIIGKLGARVASIAKKYKVKINAPRRGENPVFAMFGSAQSIAGAKGEIDMMVNQWHKDSVAAASAGNATGNDDGNANGYGANPYMGAYTNNFFSGYQAPNAASAYYSNSFTGKNASVSAKTEDNSQGAKPDANNSSYNVNEF